MNNILEEVKAVAAELEKKRLESGGEYDERDALEAIDDEISEISGGMNGVTIFDDAERKGFIKIAALAIFAAETIDERDGGEAI